VLASVTLPRANTRPGEEPITRPNWIRAVSYLARKREFPGRQRRAKWDAERKFSQLLLELRPGDIVIDCGANIGKFTEPLSRTGATVFVFEPDPYCFEILSETFGKAPNVTLHNKAVGITDGSIKFYRAHDFETDPGKRSLSSSVYGSKLNVDATRPIVVDQIDLIGFIENLPAGVRLLKMDVEGAEIPILETLIETGVISKVSNIFAETHERGIPELASRTVALRAKIRSEGYDNINLDWR
jgi:FkbM family methyltransferase